MNRRPFPHPRQLLRRANRMKDNSQFVEAAEIFEMLGKGAQERGLTRRAPQLYLQAAHCRLLAGHTERGLGLLSFGLRLIEESHQWYALHQAGEIFVAELKRIGQGENAVKIQAWLDKALQNHPEAAHPAPPSGLEASRKTPHLPEKCPYCGATLGADLVEWMDERTAECMYCGSSVQAED